VDKRAEVVFWGHVQGVGFRFTTVQLAKQFAVTGWVRNEPDGRVRMVSEGTREEIQSFLDALNDRMRDFVAGSDIQWSEATGKWPSFSIEH
jgi:acylphosphatase